MGVLDDNGRLKGQMKLGGAGGAPSPVTFSRMEKSTISLLRTIPVLGERYSAPKYEFMVVVMETAFLSLSTIDK